VQSKKGECDEACPDGRLRGNADERAGRGVLHLASAWMARCSPCCGGSLDIPPICPPRICPIAVPSIVPINPPTVPPIGMSSCRQARICDPAGNCRWQQVCS